MVATAVYVLTSYGGIRSSDAEVVYRASEGLLDTGRLVVREPSLWARFGTAPGVDGSEYSVFGPGQSVVAAPAVALGRTIGPRVAEDPDHVSPSHYLRSGFEAVAGDVPLRRDLDAHRARMVAGLFNAPVTALGLVFFWLLARFVARDERAAWIATVALGLGTTTWSYAGTFFSEPLATTLVLASTWAVVVRGASRTAALLGGLALGAAVATHVSMLLFVPFIGALLWFGDLRSDDRRGSMLAFAVGLSVPLALLAWSNVARFGSPFETGRTADLARFEEFKYGTFTAPWPGIPALVASWGKGWLVFSPLVILGLAGWPALNRRHRAIALVLALALVTRIAFIGSRSDWHGGYGLGPRYLVVATPFALLGLAAWLGERRHDPRAHAAVLGATALAVVQQGYFVAGDVFSYSQRLNQEFLRRGADVFANDAIYLDLALSPLHRLHESPIGGWLARRLDLAPPMTWGLLTIATAVPLLFWAWRTSRTAAPSPADGERAGPPSDARGR